MTALNESIFLWFHQFTGRSIFFDGIAIFFAQYVPYILVVGFLVLVAYENGWRRKFYLFAEGLIAVIISRGLVTELIRFFYHHERPFAFYNFTPLIGESGYSFPSGHATFFFALALVIWYSNRTWGFWCLVLVLLNGVARIYVGVHWPLDVAGGALIGIITAMLVHGILGTSRKNLYDSQPSLGASSGG